jgi:SAM-dependent methyltransferase
MNKKYDKSYFDRWYRAAKNGRGSRSFLERKVHLAVSIAEFYLERPIRSVLDVGCGEAPWRSALLKLRPNIRYQGLDSSDYAVARYGRSRNIAYADFAQLELLRPGPPVDLLVCSDILHYLPTKTVRAGLKGFAELCHGVAFIEVFCKEDEIVGDKKQFQLRNARWYRQQFTDNGFIACGTHCYLAPELHSQVSALERI